MPERGTLKLVAFRGDSLDRLRAFPQSARREGGFQLDRVQRGLRPNDSKPMKSVGAGSSEIRIRDAAGAFRVIYVAQLKDAVYVLHCFQKKTEKTAKSDVKLARKRYKELMRAAR
ncbi:MAG: type II toxin-antitoxin system RelE/ParE family toxin [Burkholderiales bacterium]